jgi:hypothetical protein
MMIPVVLLAIFEISFPTNYSGPPDLRASLLSGCNQCKFAVLGERAPQLNSCRTTPRKSGAMVMSMASNTKGRNAYWAYAHMGYRCAGNCYLERLAVNTSYAIIGFEPLFA